MLCIPVARRFSDSWELELDLKGWAAGPLWTPPAALPCMPAGFKRAAQKSASSTLAGCEMWEACRSLGVCGVKTQNRLLGHTSCDLVARFVFEPDPAWISRFLRSRWMTSSRAWARACAAQQKIGVLCTAASHGLTVSVRSMLMLHRSFGNNRLRSALYTSMRPMLGGTLRILW